MRYRFCSSCTEEMDRQLREDESAPEEMQGYNCIMIYSPDKSRLLFCKRLKDPYEGKFNLVGGKIEPGEDHFDAAYRELFEETGYAGSEPVFLCKVAPNAACISNFAHCYLIRDCKKVSSQHLDATEDLEIVVMSAEETKKLMAEGGLVQAVHVAAMYYAEKILNK